MKELFEGNESLFRGLEVHGRSNWSVRYPAVRLDFSGANFSEEGALDEDLAAQLDAIERETGVEASYSGASTRFRHLVQALHEKCGQRVVVLVDEYDKPIQLIGVEFSREDRSLSAFDGESTQDSTGAPNCGELGARDSNSRRGRDALAPDPRIPTEAMPPFHGTIGDCLMTNGLFLQRQRCGAL